MNGKEILWYEMTMIQCNTWNVIKHCLIKNKVVVSEQFNGCYTIGMNELMIHLKLNGVTKEKHTLSHP